MLAALNAIERELAGSRLLRLLLAVECSDLPLEDGLRRLRAALRGPPPPLA